MAASSRSLGLLGFLTLLVLGAGIAACDRAPQHEAQTKVSAVPPPAPPSPMPAVTEGAKNTATANANDQPMKAMTQGEESASMPQPGQANDHSTLAKDSKK